MEFWEELNIQWQKAKKEIGLDEEKNLHEAYMKLTDQEHEEARESLRNYRPEEHAYNGPYNDNWVSAGVSHAIDYTEINQDFYHPEWVRGYDI